MFVVNYVLIFLLVVFECYVLFKVVKKSNFKKNDIYISQFLIESLVMFILANILLFFTINFFGKPIAFVNQFLRISYILILCKATLLLATYTFSFLSISKKTDIFVHICLVLSYAVPIILIIGTPFYISITDAPIMDIPQLFTNNALKDVQNPSFIKDVYSYILGFEVGGVYFNKIALIGWGFIVIAYICIIISTAIKRTRIHAKKIEYYYLYQVLLIFVILCLYLVGQPYASCIYILYYTKMVMEVLIFILVLNIVEKSEDAQ